MLAALGDHAATTSTRLFVLPGFADHHPELAARIPSAAPVGGERRALRVVAEPTWLASACAGATTTSCTTPAAPCPCGGAGTRRC